MIQDLVEKGGIQRDINGRMRYFGVMIWAILAGLMN